MTDKILGTFFTRIIATLTMLVVVIINTNVFHAAGTGTIALVVLGLTLLQVLSNFVGGGTLVYLIPKKSNFQLVFLSYCWSLVSNVAGLALLRVFRLIPPEYTVHLLVLAMAYSVFYIHTALMQGKEDIRTYNLFQLSQCIVLLVLLCALLIAARLMRRTPAVDLYLWAYIGSYLLPAAASCRYLKKHVGRPQFNGILRLLGEMLKLGFWTQIANLTQLLTYRLNYYLIEAFAGKKTLGVYDIGTKMSEAVWIFPKSICLVQYARIANADDDDYSRRLTLGLLKIVFLFAIAAVGALLLLPAPFIALVFGPEFAEAKSAIVCLAPGIVFLSCLTIIAHHFSGYGKYWVNAVSSLIGLAITAVAGFLFIPQAARAGLAPTLRTAGLVSSGAYLGSLLFSLCLFFRQTHVSWKQFFITKDDCRLFKHIIKEKTAAFRQKTQP